MQNRHTCFLLAAAVLAFTAATPAHAQVPRTWVSGIGDDSSVQCARNAPCKTFAGAISKTTTGGEINCVDPGGFGQLTINKSITVDCHDVMGHVQAASGAGITINLDSQANMIVRIRNINFNGLLTGTRGISIIGNTATSANNAVSIEDCAIDGFTQNGIFAGSTFGGRLLVRNTTIRNNFGPALSVAAQSGQQGSLPNVATLDNVSAFDSSFGFAFGNAVQAIVKNSISSGNTNAGVEADTGAVVAISSSTVIANGTGILASPGSTVRVRDSDVSFNTAGFSGTVQSHVNNSFLSNGAGGTIVPVAGGVTNPQGLQ